MTDNIFTRLAKVSATVGAVHKDGRNGNQNYNFRGIDHVVNACHKALHENGVVVFPQSSSAEYVAGKTPGGKATNVIRLSAVYRFACGPDDYVDAHVVSEANDSADKGTAKAHSVALRTALLQVLMLPTDEPDPDESYDEAQPVSELEQALGELMQIAKAKDIVSDVKELAEEQFGKKVPELDVEQVREMIKFAESAP